MDNLLQNFTNAKAPTLAATYNATISSSAAVTLNAGTTTVQVTAIAAGIFMKWNATASSSSFDEFIGAGLTRVFVRPTAPAVTTVQFIQESATAKVAVIEK